MKKILYVSGTRADYNLMKSVLESIEKHGSLELEIVATGMHLMDEFGNTYNEIEKDNFKLHKINTIIEKDDRHSMAIFLGKFIQKLTEKIEEIKPDMILVLGDRIEMLGAAMTGAYLGIPIAHAHGGEVTETIDEVARHAITKLANIHFPATEQSAERIIKMGENKKFVFVTGAPGLDPILNQELLSKEKIFEKYSFDTTEHLLIVIQHSVTSEFAESSKQMEETMEAIKEKKIPALVIYPNSDPGGREIIKTIEKYRQYNFIHISKNIPSLDFLSLMKHATAIIGNSSCGIIEAPSFHLPAINIGTRQKGRERANNVIDVNYDKDEIKAAIEKSMSPEFIAFLKQIKNPYGDGLTGQRIAKILAEVEIQRNSSKKITY